MRRLLIALGFLSFISPSFGSEIENLASAIAEAKEVEKAIYISFIGSDWSVASKFWISKIAKSDSFKSFAKDELILLTMDARRKPPLQKLETAKLQAMVIEFNIKTYPTFILLNSDGVEIHRHGYLDISPEKYVEALTTLLN